MKKIIFLLFPLFSMAQTCPPNGDNKNAKIQAADLLKNRSYYPGKDKAKEISLEDLMADKVTDTGFVFVDAYITSAKISGVESCECHIADKAFQDYHIYISYVGTDKLGKHNQVVEVSRYSRQVNPGIGFDYVKGLIGHKVRIYGYTFFDEEHKSAIGGWRAGIEEIHPVLFIDKLDKILFLNREVGQR